jgi:hypothetical protein
LAETRTEREAFEPAHMRHAHAFLEDLARGLDGFPFEVAAADRMPCRIARDNHLRAGFARRRSFDARDRHQHGGVAVCEQLLQIG